MDVFTNLTMWEILQITLIAIMTALYFVVLVGSAIGSLLYESSVHEDCLGGRRNLERELNHENARSNKRRKPKTRF
jgi:hypothetical protein